MLVNREPEEWCEGRIAKTQGDGRSLAYADNSFDIAYSNSVIEHVGGWEDQVAFAGELRRVAPRYYVQTPNRRFFVEPHLVVPFIHWLPRRLLRRLVQRFTVIGWIDRPDQAQVDAMLAGIRLLDRREFETLFPDATIIEERCLGMVKSFIAVRLTR